MLLVLLVLLCTWLLKLSEVITVMMGTLWLIAEYTSGLSVIV